MPGVRDEARSAEQVCRDQSLGGGAAGAGVAAERAGLTLSEWERDLLIVSSVAVSAQSSLFVRCGRRLSIYKLAHFEQV
jgi:hypothetical protein